MKKKSQISKRLLSFMLALLMVIGMLPMSMLTTYGASEYSSYAPTRKENHFNDYDAIFANGTPITIEAAQNGTRIWYMDGATKKYVTNNGEKGEDLSTWDVFVGSNTPDGMYGVNGSITMTGGKVNKIYAGQSSGYFGGTSNITILGGTISDNIKCDTFYYMNNNFNRIDTVNIFDITNSEIYGVNDDSYNAIQKNGTSWNVKGNGVVPSDITVTVNEGETMIVPFDCYLTNNGTIINKGTITLKGPIMGNAIQNEGGTIQYECSYIKGVSSISSISAKINGEDFSLTNRYQLVDDTLYVLLPSGDAEVTLNGIKYYGIISAEQQPELTTTYVGASDFSNMPTQMDANTTIQLDAIAEPKDSITFSQEISYEIVSNGTSAKNAKIDGTSLYATGEGIVKVRVTSTDGYTSYSEDFDIAVNFTPVTGLVGEVPTSVLLNQKVKLPTAAPTNASYKTVTWSVLSGEANITNGVFAATQTGTVTIRGTIKHGLGYNNPYTRDYTFHVSTITGNTIDVSGGNVTISKENDTQLRVTFGGYANGYELISNKDILVLTGTAVDNCVVKVDTDAVANIALNNCSISYPTAPLIVNTGAKLNLTLVGDNVLSSTSTEYDFNNKCAGILVPKGAEIIIGGDGSLTANAGVSGAGIGGGNGSAGTITINSGNITANGDDAGIGSAGVYKYTCGNITINGGTVIANGGSQNPGIGTNNSGSGGSITINGGTIIANGNSGGAGIGGANRASIDSITINGGTITAISSGGAGIGSGYSGSVGKIVITGGNINASSNYGDDVGNGDYATSTTTIKNAEGKNVSLYTITLDGVSEQSAISSIQGMSYGINDVYTLNNNKLYFYLPNNTNPTSITAKEVLYYCTQDDQTFYADHDWSNKDGICTRCGENCEHKDQTDINCEICGKVLHIHNWKYTKTSNTISVKCIENDCPRPNGGSMTLKVADTYYTGYDVLEDTIGVFADGITHTITYNDSADNIPNAVGTYTVKLTAYENGIEKESISDTFTISYLEAPANPYSIAGAYEDNGTYWFKDGDSVTVYAPENYHIGTTIDAAYNQSVSFVESDNKVIYLRRIDDGALTDAINVEGIAFDKTAPTGKITIENRGFWETLINKVSFNLFFKGDIVANVEAIDNESGVNSIQYYVADRNLIRKDDVATLEEAINNNWKNYNNEIPLTKNEKNVVYIKITDNVGNVTYLNSEGIILYSDAQADTESVSVTYKEAISQDIRIKQNGNTIKSIANGSMMLDFGDDYEIAAYNVITIKEAYLNTLEAGTYTFTITYNPLGEAYVDASNNDEPATTTFNVVVEKANGKVSNIVINDKIYDGTAITEPTFDQLGDGNATIEYKVKDSDDSTYTTVAPKDANDYIVRISVAEGTNHKEAFATAEFTIHEAELNDVSVQQNEMLVYNGNSLTPTIKESATSINNQPVSFTYSINVDGTYGDLPNFTDANTYTVYFKATAPNHNETIGSFTVEIKKGNVTYTAPTPNNLTYTGVEQNLVSEGSVEGGEMLYALGTDDVNAPTEHWVETIPQGKDVDTYYVWYKIVGDHNHNDVDPDCVPVSIKKASQIAPNVEKTDETISKKADGIITGVDATMEYRAEDETTHTDITDLKIENLAAGTYYVRRKGDHNHEPSPDREVIIETGRKLTVTVPQNQVGYQLTTSTPEVDWHDMISIKFELLDGYTMLENFEIYNGSDPLWNQFNKDTGILQLNLVDKDYDLTIQGVEDVTPPTAEITIQENKWTSFLNDITFDLFFKETQDVTIHANDIGSGVKTIQYYLSDTELELDRTRANIDWIDYHGTFKIDPNNQYVIYAKVSDNDGNILYINSNGMILDDKAPTINGIEDKETYYTTQKVTIDEEYVDAITVNGEPVTLNDDAFMLAGNVDTTYNIVVSDKAGNTTSMSITMKPISELSTTIDDLTNENVNSSNKEVIETAKEAVESVDTTNASEAEKQALQEIKDKAAELEKVIDDTKAEIDRIHEERNKYDENIVNSNDKDSLEQLGKDIKALTDGNNLTDDERTVMNETADEVEEMQKIIDDTVAENERITDTVDNYDLTTVTSDDKDDLEQLLDDINKQLESTHLTEEETSTLENEKKAVEEFLNKINDITEQINKVNKEVENYNEDSVKSTDKDDIEQLIEEIDTLLETNHLTDKEREDLEDTKEKANDLLDIIEKAAKASNTNNIKKVKDVTVNNVTPEHKTDLEKAKKDLEKALEDYKGNYTKGEKKDIENELKRINDALAIIYHVEEVEALINKLPATITKDDETAIKEAEDAYHALTSYEKSLVDKEVKKALDDAKKALAQLKNPTKPNTPPTQDNSHIMLWMILFFISSLSFITLIVVDRKTNKVDTNE